MIVRWVGREQKGEEERRESFLPLSLSLLCLDKLNLTLRVLWFHSGSNVEGILEKRENWKRLDKSWTFCCHISIPVIANLRKKFEEDKKRIAEMKSARKFRPYWYSCLLFIFVKHSIMWAIVPCPSIYPVLCVVQSPNFEDLATNFFGGHLARDYAILQALSCPFIVHRSDYRDNCLPVV